MGLCFDEARLVRARVNQYHATQAMAVQLAIGSGQGNKKAFAAFKKMVAKLIED